MIRCIAFIGLCTFSVTLCAQNKAYDLNFMVNGVAVAVEPIYDKDGTPMSNGSLYENVQSVRIGEDSLSLGGSIISDYVGSATVMCDLIVETHFGYQVYQLSENTTLDIAETADVGEGRRRFSCTFNDISQLMASSGTFVGGGEYLVHIWFMPLNKRISNIPLLIEDEHELANNE